MGFPGNLCPPKGHSQRLFHCPPFLLLGLSALKVCIPNSHCSLTHSWLGSHDVLCLALKSPKHSQGVPPRSLLQVQAVRSQMETEAGVPQPVSEPGVLPLLPAVALESLYGPQCHPELEDSG